MDGKMIGIRMHEIMEETGMRPKDFFELNEITDGKVKFTRSNFYNYYSGKVKKPSIEYIDLFCEIADIPYNRFSQKKADEFVITEDEKKLVMLIRQLTRENKTHLKNYIQLMIDEKNKKEVN